jgi:serine O-acetyltransferase
MSVANERRPVPRPPGVPSATEPDWSREAFHRFEWNPSRRLIRTLRDYADARTRGGASGLVRSKVAVLRHRFWSMVTGAEVPLGTTPDGGFYLPHPHGVVVHPGATIGPNCVIFQGVTIGTGPKPGAPRLGGHVDVGPGAKILGGVSIGDDAVIGANAVVLDDVPAGAVAVGVPAIVRPRK